MLTKSRGFTLIEVLVVIAITGILTTIALPSFTQSLAQKRLEGAANELSADLHYAKSQSVSLNSNVTLLTSAGGYTISSAITTYKTVILTPEIRLTNAIAVTFEPYLAAPTGIATISMSFPSANLSLNVKTSVTGLIQICAPSTGFASYIVC